MKFLLLPRGSGGFSIDGLLSKLFPPRLTPLDRDGLKDVLAYQYRISRRGEERNPHTMVGAQVLGVRQWRNNGHKSRTLTIEMYA